MVFDWLRSDKGLILHSADRNQGDKIKGELKIA